MPLQTGNDWDIVLIAAIIVALNMGIDTMQSVKYINYLHY